MAAADNGSAPRLWTPARRVRVAALAALGLAQAMAAIAVAWAASRLMAGESSSALMACLAMGAGGLALSRVVQRRYAERFALGYVAELRAALASRALRAPIEAEPGLGVAMSRLVNDLSALKIWLADGLVGAVVATTALLGLTAGLLAMDPQLALALVPPVLVWTAFAALTTRPLDAAIRDCRRLRGRIAGRVGRMLTARLTLLVNGRHGAELHRLDRGSWRLNDAMTRRATLSGALSASGDLAIPAAAIAVALGVLGAERPTPDRLALMLLTVGLGAAHLQTLSTALEKRLAARIAAQRVSELLGRPALELARGARGPQPRAGFGLRVAGAQLGDGARARFAIGPGEHAVLTGLDAAQTRRLFMSIAGLTGGVADGVVSLSGVDLSRVRRRDWWRSVALISEATPFVSGDALRNATLGERTAARDRRNATLAALGLTGAALACAPPAIGVRGRDGPAIRAARALLRDAGLILIDDAELLGDAVLLNQVLEEAQALGATVVIGAADATPAGDRAAALPRIAVACS